MARLSHFTSMILVTQRNRKNSLMSTLLLIKIPKLSYDIIKLLTNNLIFFYNSFWRVSKLRFIPTNILPRFAVLVNCQLCNGQLLIRVVVSDLPCCCIMWCGRPSARSCHWFINADYFVCHPSIHTPTWSFFQQFEKVHHTICIKLFPNSYLFQWH